MTHDDDPWQYARQDENQTPLHKYLELVTKNGSITVRKYLLRMRMQARLRGNTELVKEIDAVIENSTDEWLDEER